MELLDGPLFKTLQTLPPFPFAQLVRPDIKSIRLSQQAFLLHGTLPHFTFQRALTFNASLYNEALKVTEERLETLPALNDIHALYQEKITEIRTRLNLIIALQEHNDQRVAYYADQLFGAPEQSHQELAQEFEAMFARAHTLRLHKQPIDAAIFARMVRATLDYYHLNDWTIRQTSRPSVSVIHGDDHHHGTVKIPKKFLASRARAARVLTHEIEVHALRTANGFTSPIALLGRGLSGYIATEEGLAAFLQQKIPRTTTHPGFWDAWAAALTQHHDFATTFDTLYRARKNLHQALGNLHAEQEARDTAWRLMIRVSRGIHRPGAKGIAYRRDHIYRSGLLNVQRAFRDTQINLLPTLFAGHAGIHHLPLLDTLGIKGRIPDFMSKTIVKNTLRSIKTRS